MFGKLIIMTLIFVLALKFMKFVTISLLVAYYQRSPSGSSSAEPEPDPI